MDTPVRKYQKQKDYQRHKLFRKMKRRRKAAIEQAKDAPMKPLRRKFKIPKFEGGKDDKPLVDRPLKPNIFRRSDGSYFYQADPNAEEIDLTPLNTGLSNDPSQWTYTDAAGKIYTPAQPLVNNTGEITQGRKNTWDGYFTRPITKYFDELKYRANTNPSSIALHGKYTMPAIAASALLPLAGEAAYPLLTNPYVDATITSGFGAHGLNHAINEGIDGWGDAAMTALEIAPLGRLAKPMWNASKEGLQYAAKAADNAASITSKQRNTGYRTAALSVQQDAEYLTNPVLKRKFLEANENVKNGTASDSDKRFIESMKKVIDTKRGAVPISEESKQEMLEYYSSKRYRDRVLKNVGDGEIADAFIDDALQTIKNTPIERNPLHPRFTKNSDVGTVEGVTLPTRTTPEGTQSVIVLNENAGQDVINHEINHAVDFANSAAIENNKRFPLKEATPSKFIQNGKPYMLDDVEPRTRAISLDMFLAKHPEFTIDDAYKSWYDPFHTDLSFNDLPIDARNFIAHYTEETGRNYFDNFYSWLLPPLLGGGTASFMLPAATDDSYDRGKDKHKIYIKPKNRGKFNALKKRTGKTTEQLTHSKNPLTRKRAIFAQNAKKWKH